MRPTTRAAKACADWLAYCREIGWHKDDMSRLADIWWDFHDDDGTLRDMRHTRNLERQQSNGS